MFDLALHRNLAARLGMSINLQVRESYHTIGLPPISGPALKLEFGAG